MLLGCHVNVEFCANLLGSIKYIHSTFPRVLIMPPLLSLQMVTLMRYTIIKTAATLVLLKQCGEFSNSLYTAALSWYDLPSPSLPTSSDLQPHPPPLCLFCLQSAPTPMCTCATCMTMSCPLSD